MATVLRKGKPVSVSDALGQASLFDLLHKKGTVSAGAMGRLFKTLEDGFKVAKAAAMSNPMLASIITGSLDILKKVIPPRNTVAYATSDLEADDNKPVSHKRGKSVFARVAPAVQKLVTPPPRDMHKRARNLMGMQPADKKL